MILIFNCLLLITYFVLRKSQNKIAKFTLLLLIIVDLILLGSYLIELSRYNIIDNPIPKL